MPGRPVRARSSDPSGRQEAGMGPFEQDWMELGFRVAKAMHHQTRWARSHMEQAIREAEGAAEQ
jgi:hypothetical protein